MRERGVCDGYLGRWGGQLVVLLEACGGVVDGAGNGKVVGAKEAVEREGGGRN